MPETTRGDRGGGFRHRVGAVGNDDLILVGLKAVLHDEGAIGLGHFETVDHHHGANGGLDPRSSQPKHLGNMGILKEELAGAFVIFLVEGAAGDEYSDGHGKSE